jgi:UDP-glucose 4-epimerase
MILIIGATGYIGRYLCPYLKNKGYDVLAAGRAAGPRAFLESKGIPFTYLDFDKEETIDALPTEKIDTIVDLSACLAELETPVAKFFDINTLGAYKVLEFARKNNIKRVVLTSSHKVYNDIYKNGPISEDDGIDFTGDHSPYIISKIAAEYFVKYYNKDFGLAGIVLRLTGVHGYGEILGHLNEDGSYKKSTFELFFEKALKGDKIEVWGDQSIRRDHIYVYDVLSAIEAAINAKEDVKGIYNIASGVGYSQYDEACTLAKVFGTPGHISDVVLKPEKPGLSRGYVYDISKAARELNWHPDFSSLEKMLVDYKREWIAKEYHNYHFIRENDRPATL